MTEIDYYDLIRQKLELGVLHAPKHKKILKLLKVFWDEDEIKLLSHFDKAGNFISKKELAEKSGIPKEEVKRILARSVKNGTIGNKGARYTLLPLIPGIFEKYFIVRKDNEENQKKAAQLFWDIIREIKPQVDFEKEVKSFRPLLPYEAKEKLIEINESLDYNSQALPYELVKEMIDQNEYFAVIPCQCRLVAELSGDPCECAPAEMGCFLAGIAARGILEMTDGARALTKEEAIQFLKDTEKAGLVHNASFGSEESGMFICNCCSCHCAALYPARVMHFKNTNTSNYTPKINMDLCVKCETCIKKCPSGAIYHKWPNETDSSDEKIVIREELCIGCGVCAANCPQDAIKMIKVRDVVPEKGPRYGDYSMGDLISM